MNRRRTKTTGIWVGVLMVAVAVATLTIVELRTQGTTAIDGFTVANYRARVETEDRPAPDFELPSLQGDGSITLSSFRGYVLVLNFWASWCGPCRLEAPGLRRASAKYRAQGVRFLGVDYRDDKAAARAFVKGFHLPYPSAFDPAGTLAYRYGLIGFPTTFIIDPGGTIGYRFVGYLQQDVLEAALDDVLSRPSS
jgi:cytochrome c biogenesis protein CcmG, thiol:disulfide interchange protein DsbE